MIRSACLALALLFAAPVVLAQAPERLDPNGTRLFLSPTARTMPQGQGRFSDYMVFFPSVAYGFTDWLDASVGISILPGSSTQILTVNTKARAFSAENVDIAVGGLFLTPVGEGGGEGFGGTVYGLATFGSARRSVSLGTYVAYAGYDGTTTTCFEDVCEVENDFGFSVSDGVVVMAGGELQLSNSIKLLTENYVAFGDGSTGGIVSGGIRFFGERLAVDLAFFRPFDSVNDDLDGFPFVPYVGFAYNFGR